jgi:transcriptional regulator with XRE-family HTH domain
MLRLREERRRRQWTQQRLSALTGIAQSDLSAFENERRQAGVGQRERIARVFGMTEAELFTPDVEPTEAHV